MRTMLPLANYARVNNAYTTWESFLYSQAASPQVLISSSSPYDNTCPAGILADPLDASKKLFWRGEFIGDGSDGGRISLFTGSSIDNPLDLGTLHGVVLSGSESYDINGIRFGCPVFISGTEVWYYYVGIGTGYEWQICRATSTDGGRTYTKQGVVLTYNGTTEFGFSGPGIWREGGTWYMNYTEWSGPVDSAGNHDPGSSNIGIKLATSSDGISWTKTGTTLIAVGGFSRLEDAQPYKFGDHYVLLYNAAVFGVTFHWGCYVASNTVLTTTYTKQKPFLYDYAVVRAVPFLFSYSDGFTYIYYQQEDSPGVDNIWVAKLIPPN